MQARVASHCPGPEFHSPEKGGATVPTSLAFQMSGSEIRGSGAGLKTPKPVSHSPVVRCEWPRGGAALGTGDVTTPGAVGRR